MVDDLEIKKCYDDDGEIYWTVCNNNGKQENHTHFVEYRGAKMFKKLVENKEIPRNDYFKKSAKRVSIDKKYLKTLK